MGVELALFQRFFDLLFIVNEKEKGEVLENDIVFEDSFMKDLFAYFLFFFFLRKKKVRESRRKEQKEERLYSPSANPTVPDLLVCGGGIAF